MRRKKAIVTWKAKAGPDLILLFGDSAEVSLMPTITRCWTRQGQQRVILTPGARAAKCWDWGSVDPLSGRTIHLLHPRRNNVGFRRLLAAISRAYELPTHPERQVVLFVDNDKAHDAKPVRQLVAKYKERLHLEWLPSYTPELNPQEDIWQQMRRQVTHNHYFEQLDALVEAVDKFHCDLEGAPEQVLRLISKWARVIAS